MGEPEVLVLPQIGQTVRDGDEIDTIELEVCVQRSDITLTIH
jgi:hypothetical protein